MFTPPQHLFRTGSPLIIFVIPEAFTPVCTRTLQQASKLKSVKMVGMSTDNQSALDYWASKSKIRMEVLADNDREYIVSPHRGTYVYDEQHNLMAVIHTEDLQKHFEALYALRPELMDELAAIMAAQEEAKKKPELTGAALENAKRNGLV